MINRVSLIQRRSATVADAKWRLSPSGAISISPLKARVDDLGLFFVGEAVVVGDLVAEVLHAGGVA